MCIHYPTFEQTLDLVSDKFKASDVRDLLEEWDANPDNQPPEYFREKLRAILYPIAAHSQSSEVLNADKRPAAVSRM